MWLREVLPVAVAKCMNFSELSIVLSRGFGALLSLFTEACVFSYVRCN